MPGDPKIRASDADRDRAAALLSEHHAAGRLTVEEFSERLDQALTAKTIGDLDELFADLPSIDLYRLPDASLRRPPPSGKLPSAWMSNPSSGGGRSSGGSRFSAGSSSGPSAGPWSGGGPFGGHPPSVRTGGSVAPSLAAAWLSWAAVNSVVFVIWVVSALSNGGGNWFPWFLFCAIPSTLALAHRIRRTP
jgi:hypothetical protein